MLHTKLNVNFMIIALKKYYVPSHGLK